GAEGKDIVGLLQNALEARNIRVTVTALLNDTVGALVACSYRHPNTLMGIILGTGSNAAYMEKIANIPKFDLGAACVDRKTVVTADDEMVINMEWGAFDNEGDVIPYNRYDRMLDNNSSNVGRQMFEKRISGLYLGEIFRLVILDLVRLQLIFKGQISCALETPYVLDTSVISRMVDDESPNFEEGARVVSTKLGLECTSPADRYMVRRTATTVAYRSARFAGAAIGAVILRRSERLAAASAENPLAIGVDGSLYEHFRTFRETMVQSLTETIGAENMTKINISLTKDGSGVGAAVTAIMSAQGKCL
ncbi:hexokinase, partial [Dimargaris cristalligena]